MGVGAGQLSSKVAPVSEASQGVSHLWSHSQSLSCPGLGDQPLGRDPIWKNLNESIRMEREARRGGSRKVLKGLSGLGAGHCGVLLGAV